MKIITDNRGYSLAEVVMAIGVFVIFLVFASSILVNSLQSNREIFEQLTTQSDARKTISDISNFIRRAESSDIGSFAVYSATTSEFIFYTNADSDDDIERMRLWLENGELKKGVIDPSGDPLEYLEENEYVIVIAEDIINENTGNPVFEYFDENYTGVEDPLENPVAAADVRVIKIQLDFEKDPAASNEPLHIETSAFIRSLKSN